MLCLPQINFGPYFLKKSALKKQKNLVAAKNILLTPPAIQSEEDNSCWRKHISIQNPLYVREREKFQQASAMDFGWGEDELILYKRDPQSPNPFSSSRHQIMNLFKNGSQDRKTCEIVVDEVLQNKIFYKELLRKKIVSDSRESVFAALLDDKFDDMIFAKFLENHINYFKREIQGFLLFANKTREEFRTKAFAEIDSGYFRVSKDKISYRLDELVFTLKDPILGDPNLGGHTLWEVSVNGTTPEYKRRQVLFHEFMHAIAGKSIMLYKEGPFYAVEFVKSGLNFIKPKGQIDAMPNLGKWEWLSEALTENMSSYLLGEETIEYYNERSSLREMIGKGIPENYFRDAYFEDNDPEVKKGGRLFFSRKLFREMHRFSIAVNSSNKKKDERAVEEELKTDEEPEAVSWRRRINEENPIYINEREKHYKRLEAKTFGEIELGSYSRYQILLSRFDAGELSDYPGGREAILKELNQSFFYLRHHIINLFKSGERYARVCDYIIGEVLENKSLCQQIVGQNPSLNSKELVFNVLLNNTLEDVVFAKFLENHVAIFREKLDIFLHFAEKTREEFRKEALAASDSGYLKISKEKINARIDEIYPTLIDPINNPVNLGEYRMWEASVNDIVPEEERRLALFHELTHAIAGKSFMLYKQGPFYSIDLIKNGLSWRKPRKQMKAWPNPVKLEWMDEAITENIALYLSGEKVGGYGFERAALSVITNKGVPEMFFREAYFEDNDPETKAGERLFFTRKLFREIHGRIDHATLVYLSSQRT